MSAMTIQTGNGIKSPEPWEGVGGWVDSSEDVSHRLLINQARFRISVFQTVRVPGGAPRGGCQEPWTGRDGEMRSAIVLETSGRPSLWRTAGPAR